MHEIAYQIAVRRLRWKHLAAMRRLKEQDSLTGVPHWARPTPHKHRRYRGPWIENYFFTYWARSELFRERIAAAGFEYLPIFWTDLRHAFPGAEMSGRLRALISSAVDPRKRYFTLIQHSAGIEIPLPENVLVFSAGGTAGVPIPLLKYPESYRIHQKRHLVSFQGATTGAADLNGIRSRMIDIASQIPGFVHPRASRYTAYRELITRSRFTLCPRGFGPTSFRLYETLALGSIPIYIWDDFPWLPYEEQLDWTRLALTLQASELDRLPDLIQSTNDDQQRTMIDYAARHFGKCFSYPGVCERIAAHLGSARLPAGRANQNSP